MAWLSIFEIKDVFCCKTVSVHVCLCVNVCRYLERPEDDIGFPGVTGSCEHLPYMLGMELRSSSRAVHHTLSH